MREARDNLFLTHLAFSPGDLISTSAHTPDPVESSGTHAALLLPGELSANSSAYCSTSGRG